MLGNFFNLCMILSYLFEYIYMFKLKKIFCRICSKNVIYVTIYKNKN